MGRKESNQTNSVVCILCLMQSLVLRNLLHPYYQIIDEDKWVDPEGGGGTGGPDPPPP